jgi:hypothetical protein
MDTLNQLMRGTGARRSADIPECWRIRALAPSSAIAQLGQLDDDGRRRFGRSTLWLTLIIVGGLTLGLAAAAVRLHVGGR